MARDVYKRQTVFAAPQWTIAIDPGHGGKDPGAIGKNLGIYEKNVTLSIARELKALLDKDPNFKGVLTRDVYKRQYKRCSVFVGCSR